MTQTSLHRQRRARRTRTGRDRVSAAGRRSARPVDRASGARAERVVPRRRLLRAGRVGGRADRPADRRPAPRRLPRHDRADAGLRRRRARRRRDAADRSGDAARRQRRVDQPHGGHGRGRRRRRRSSRPVSLFAHYVRSYRHPNLEELLFSGPATAGNIVPNITVEPETGHNVDVGARVRLAQLRPDRSRTSSTATRTSSRPRSWPTHRTGRSRRRSTSRRCASRASRPQATTPFVAGGLTWSPQRLVRVDARHGARRARARSTGESLAGEPQDNITPLKFARRRCASAIARERWWAGLRRALDGGGHPRVAAALRVAVPHRAGSARARRFTVQRVAAGYDWRAGRTAARRDAGGGQPDRPVLPRAVPVRAGARAGR